MGEPAIRSPQAWPPPPLLTPRLHRPTARARRRATPPPPCPVPLPQREYERRADPNDRNAQALLEEMRQHIKKASASGGGACAAAAAAGVLPAGRPGPAPTGVPRPLLLPSPQLEEMRKNEDPRLSFSTPEFKEAQRQFTDGFKASREGGATGMCCAVLGSQESGGQPERCMARRPRPRLRRLTPACRGLPQGRWQGRGGRQAPAAPLSQTTPPLPHSLCSLPACAAEELGAAHRVRPGQRLRLVRARPC